MSHDWEDIPLPRPARPVELRRDDLHPSVSDPVAASMNFLNEVAATFPHAISLAAGSPYEGFYNDADIHRYIQVYAEHRAAEGHSPERIRGMLTQYGRTNGQIHDLIARFLATDERVRVPAEAVVVTSGCQEAMVIALRGMCAGPADVLLVAEPCYVGITGAARLLGIGVVPVPEGHQGLAPEAVAAAARQARARGKRPRALYVVPSFSNPSGVSLDVEARLRLLEVAAAEELLIVEDDPYGLFGLTDDIRPSLKALDVDRRVIYLGSFAKSVFPGARVGFLVADQPVVDAMGRRSLLAEELSKVKSVLTVNTSSIAQAVVGGVLVESSYSLRAANSDKIAFYRRNLRTLLSALDQYFPAAGRSGTAIRWNRPDGGFFVVVDVPIETDMDLLEISAREFGVLWTPMRFFYAQGGARSLRLSCSGLEPEKIVEGIRRLADFVDKMM